MPQSIVVDANIARAAGPERATHPTSMACRSFLLLMKKQNHLVVFNRKLTEEWNKHQSSFSKQWRASMIAQRKFKAVGDHPKNIETLDEINSIPTAADVREMIKDIHLLYAAEQSGKSVTSLEKKSRDLFKKYPSYISSFKSIYWVNIDEYDFSPWLIKSCKLPKKLALG